MFAAFLIFPLQRAGWRRARHWLALPVGAGIFYHDTWLPGIESIRAQGSQVFSFTLDYWAELLGRFINWEMVGAGFVLLTLYLFIAQWLRFTPWILLALLWLWVSPQVSNPFASSKGASEHALNTFREETRSSVLPMEVQLDQSAPPTNENLTPISMTSIGRSRRDWRTSRRACQPRRPPSMCSSSMSAPWPGVTWRRAA